MNMENFYVEGYKGLQLFCTRYENKNPKAVIIIVHGMQEHSGRYVELAQFLSDNGFVVITSDSRGHGKTMKDKSEYGCGKFGDIYGESIEDQLKIVEYVKENYPNLPIYLFGHSYGSMLSQTLVQRCPEIKKTILQGTNCGDNFLYRFGNFFAKICKAFGRDNNRGNVFEKAGTKHWNKISGGNWLTRNEEITKKYANDDLCGGAFPLSFYRSLTSHMIKVNKGIKKIAKDQKIMLTCGSKDPVGDFGKNVYKLFRKYEKAGVDAKIIIYAGARHELHNETNKQEVFADILSFYNN